MHRYQLIIRDKRYEGYRKIASFIFGLNAVFFIALATRSISISNKIILFTAAAVLGAYAIYNWSFKRKKERSFIAIYLLISAIWITDTPFWYFSIVFLLLLFLQLRMEKDFVITLAEQSITVDGFLKNEYPWSAFNNVVMRDGLLTLDFKNDKILQVEPDWSLNQDSIPADDETYPASEKEFNEFCSRCLKAPIPTKPE